MREKGKHFNFIYQGEKNMQKQSQMEALTFTNANPDKVDLTFQRQSEKNDNNHYVQFVFFLVYLDRIPIPPKMCTGKLLKVTH